MNSTEIAFNESARRGFVAQNTAAVQSNDEASERTRLESMHGVGNVYNTDEVRTQFEVISFAAPFVCVRRKVDNMSGFLEFQHSPRLYFNFMAK